MGRTEQQEAIATYLTMLFENFRQKATKATYIAYEAGLDGLTGEQIKSACLAALRQNREFMPNAGQLLELALSGGAGFEALAARAWQCLNRGIDVVGYNGSPNFADGLINATVRHLGGWEHVCNKTVTEFEKWFRKEFERTYLEFARNGCSPEMCRRLVGATERESARYHGLPNPRSGEIYYLPDPVEVGANYIPVVKSLPSPTRELGPLRSLPTP